MHGRAAKQGRKPGGWESVAVAFVEHFEDLGECFADRLIAGGAEQIIRRGELRNVVPEQFEEWRGHGRLQHAALETPGGPGDEQFFPRAGDGDVKEPELLFERSLFDRAFVRKQIPFERDAEDDGKFEPFRGVHGEQRDGIAAACAYSDGEYRQLFTADTRLEDVPDWFPDSADAWADADAVDFITDGERMAVLYSVTCSLPELSAGDLYRTHALAVFGSGGAEYAEWLAPVRPETYIFLPPQPDGRRTVWLDETYRLTLTGRKALT